MGGADSIADRAAGTRSLSPSESADGPIYPERTEEEVHMKITVETVVNAALDRVWEAWNDPEDIKRWNAAQDDWHTTHSTVDLREGGAFVSRMEAKDGSAGFDFEGTYTRIVPRQTIEYRMSDGREVKVEFGERPDGVLVRTAFDADSEHPPELQRQGWQAILDNFARYVSVDVSRADREGSAGALS
jgi:uncharacterized protein YndB with AHSA1/START domain